MEFLGDFCRSNGASERGNLPLKMPLDDGQYRTCERNPAEMSTPLDQEAWRPEEGPVMTGSPVGER
jgi:hypothetical protein